MEISKPRLNTYRQRKFENKTLLVSDQGQWCFVDDNILKILKEQKNFEKLCEYPFLEKNGLVITNNNISGIIKKQRANYSHLFYGTSLHIVVPTARCNHKCIYCHSEAKNISSKGVDMDKKTSQDTVDFIFQTPSDAITIEFQGGEPLLKFDIIQEIVSYAKSKNKEFKKDLRFDLVSNLSLLDHDILKYLIKENINLGTSLDGPEKVHNKNRILMGGNSYKETTYWLNEIKTNYNYPINALMVTTRHSLKYPEEIIDEYIKNNLDWIRLRHLDSLGYAHKNKSIDYSAEEYFVFWKTAVDHIVKQNKQYKITEGFIKLIMQKLSGIYTNYADFESPCGAIISQLAYSHNGDIYTCDEGRQYEMFKLGNVKKDKYKDIIKSNAACSMILSSINDSLMCDTCAYKPFCGICPVCNFADDNNLIPKLAKNKRCKIYKSIFDYIFYSLLKKPQHKKVFESWSKQKI
jgi:His-Xaa-Ser system radical SAM maturase HxsB